MTLKIYSRDNNNDEEGILLCNLQNFAKRFTLSILLKYLVIVFDKTRHALACVAHYYSGSGQTKSHVGIGIFAHLT